MKKKPIIKAIIFDLGGVIMHGGYLDFIHHFCSACLTPQGKKKILDMERQVNLGKISENEFYREIEKTFHVDLDEKQIHNAIVSKMKANKSLIAAIPKLKKARIALFTNSIGNMAPEVLKLRHVPAKKIFDKVFVSTKMHMAKPDKEAYQFVLKKMKVQPENALLVDDRIENIRPARKIGMQGLVFKNTAQFKREIKKYKLV